MAPSLLLCDGAVGPARMAADGYDFRGLLLFQSSNCLLGRLDANEANHQVEGFIAGLALLGARRVCSAMWELSDRAAPDFAGAWMSALMRHVFRDG